MSEPCFVTDTSWRDIQCDHDRDLEDFIWEGGAEMSNLSSKSYPIKSSASQEQLAILTKYVHDCHGVTTRQLRAMFWLTLAVLALIANAVLQWMLL